MTTTPITHTYVQWNDIYRAIYLWSNRRVANWLFDQLSQYRGTNRPDRRITLRLTDHQLSCIAESVEEGAY